jgi:hypothetical protein
MGESSVGASLLNVNIGVCGKKLTPKQTPTSHFISQTEGSTKSGKMNIVDGPRHLPVFTQLFPLAPLVQAASTLQPLRHRRIRKVDCQLQCSLSSG